MTRRQLTEVCARIGCGHVLPKDMDDEACGWATIEHRMLRSRLCHGEHDCFEQTSQELSLAPGSDDSNGLDEVRRKSVRWLP